MHLGDAIVSKINCDWRCWGDDFKFKLDHNANLGLLIDAILFPRFLAAISQHKLQQLHLGLMVLGLPLQPRSTMLTLLCFRIWTGSPKSGMDHTNTSMLLPASWWCCHLIWYYSRTRSFWNGLKFTERTETNSLTISARHSTSLKSLVPAASPLPNMLKHTNRRGRLLCSPMRKTVSSNRQIALDI